MNNVVQIKNLIYSIRGYRVMLDSDLAMLYKVETKRLNKAVKSNTNKHSNHGHLCSDEKMGNRK